jgi:hypothetical protein
MAMPGSYILIINKKYYWYFAWRRRLIAEFKLSDLEGVRLAGWEIANSVILNMSGN